MVGQKRTVFRQGFFGLIVVSFIALTVTTAVSKSSRDRKLTEKPFMAGSNLPLPVRAILERACQDCHSQNTKWPWYAHIPPVSWQVHKDVAKGRAFMDLSRWNEYTEGERRGFTLAIAAAIQNHLMPPPKYVWMHPAAQLSSDELSSIEEWVITRSKASSNRGGSRMSVRIRPQP
jgi:Haem-binding domain